MISELVFSEWEDKLRKMAGIEFPHTEVSRSSLQQQLQGGWDLGITNEIKRIPDQIACTRNCRKRHSIQELRICLEEV